MTPTVSLEPAGIWKLERPIVNPSPATVTAVTCTVPLPVLFSVTASVVALPLGSSPNASDLGEDSTAGTAIVNPKSEESAGASSQASLSRMRASYVTSMGTVHA